MQMHGSKEVIGQLRKFRDVGQAVRFTHVSTHASHEDNGTATQGYHVSCRLSGSKERAVDVDVVQSFHAIERVVECGIVLHDT